MTEKKSFIDSTPAKWILAIITILSLGWALFQSFHVNNPKLQYEVLSQAKLFNKTEDLSTVRLLVDTVDVLKGNQNISFYVIKVQNVGSQHLRWDDYDEGAFGLIIKDGRVLQDVDFVDASTQHIEDRFFESGISNTECFITIPKITLDRNEWYTISFSIIHSDDAIPSFAPVGKIVGQKQIIITSSSKETNQMSNREMILLGGMRVNIARAFIFLFIWLVVIVIVGNLVSGISDITNKRKKQKVLEQIIKDSSIPSFVRDDYLKHETMNIYIALNYYGLGNQRLNRAYHNALSFISSVDHIDVNKFNKCVSLNNEINRLVKEGFLLKDETGVITIPEDVMKAAEKIFTILGEENIYKRALLHNINDDIEIVESEEGEY